MRIAYLECFSGISGDMFLGALIDAGVPPDLFTRTVTALGLGTDARLEISRVDRSGISATKVDVIVAGEKELPREEFWSKEQAAHQHGHEHHPEHSHDHGHELARSHDHHQHSHEHPGHGHESGRAHRRAHRGLKEIREIINRAGISASAKERAIAIFTALGEAEARVHNTDIEAIHFHEVGAVDAIVDIVCAAVGAEALGVEQWICSPLNVGGGTVECAHGTFPIPAPATLDLLRHAPVYSGEIQKELVTPTGAAIVHVLAKQFGPFPRMKTGTIAYGAGSRNFKSSPNVVRLSVGETGAGEEEHSAIPTEEIAILEANVDDMTPQIFGYVMERALAAGALDVFGAAVQMKKNRPGMLLTVLCRPEDKSRLTDLIFAETTTLGVRMRQETRATLVRRHVAIQTQWGEVRMKLAGVNGSISNYSPEYEDCRRIAEERSVPLKTVMQEAIKVYLERKNG